MKTIRRDSCSFLRLLAPLVLLFGFPGCGTTVDQYQLNSTWNVVAIPLQPTECCEFGQRFTVGRSGMLTAVEMALGAYQLPMSTTVQVQILNDSAVLGSGSIDASVLPASDPDVAPPPLSSLVNGTGYVPLGVPAAVSAGQSLRMFVVPIPSLGCGAGPDQAPCPQITIGVMFPDGGAYPNGDMEARYPGSLTSYPDPQRDFAFKTFVGPAS